MATLSAQGRLTIPAPYRNALHLQPGDKVTFSLDGEKLVIAPTKAGKARLVKGNGRKVLVASADAPVMSASRVNELLADFP
ncbi:MAG: AbrB/MazE/SpoVT family DNA-binding domain-containing protein [Limisphaerales bacterium]